MAFWVNDALIAAALAGLAVLAAAAPLFGGAALSLARDVGNNCSVACLFGALGAALGGLGGLFGAGGGRGPWAEGSDFSALKETNSERFWESRDNPTPEQAREQAIDRFGQRAGHALDTASNATWEYFDAFFYGNVNSMDRVIEGYENPRPYGQEGPAIGKVEVIGESRGRSDSNR